MLGTKSRHAKLAVLGQTFGFKRQMRSASIGPMERRLSSIKIAIL
jgi:hypothetical protein